MARLTNTSLGSLCILTPLVQGVCPAPLEPILLVLGEFCALFEESLSQPQSLYGDSMHVPQPPKIPPSARL